VKLWIRVFLVCVSISLAAVAAIGIVSLRTGYRAVLQDAVNGMQRETTRLIRVIETQWESVQALARAYPGNELLPPESLSSLPDYLRTAGSQLVDPETQVELRFADQDLPLSAGSFFTGLRDVRRPELDAAAQGGSAYVLRRQDGDLVLYLSSATSLGGHDLIVSLASDQSSLDAYWRTQLSTLLIASLASVLVLTAASYIASRFVTRRLESLALQAGAISVGSFRGRVDETGGDEIAALAVRFNRMAEDVERTVATLRAEKEDRQKFIDALTHELRTPASSIVGFAELLRLRSWDAEVFSKALERIRAEGERILSLMESLKRLLLLRAAEREWGLLEVAPLLAKVAEEAREKHRESGLSLRVEAESGFVSADPQLIETALHNLVDNAARYAPPGSAVILGLRDADGERTVFVRDFGPGMTDAEIARAGEPFARGVDRKGGGGFGLGLAICRETAAHHGARLVFERPAGGGLLVGIAFPNLHGIYRRETDP
jgi:signal transduction histidine kinase